MTGNYATFISFFLLSQTFLKYIINFAQVLIAVEEMLHMALACNMLTAIGGIAEINTNDVLPKYPGPLPGGVNPDLVVSLRALSHESVKVFLEIEYPEFGSITTLSSDTYATIGAFGSAKKERMNSLVKKHCNDE